MKNRDTERKDFIAHSSWKNARIEPLDADASFRRYFRLTQNGKTAILMDAPPTHEACAPFVAIAHFLEGLELTIPSIFESDLENGFLILKDLGNQHLKTLVDQAPHLEIDYYKDAANVIACLSCHSPPKSLPVFQENQTISLAAYDNDLFFKELAIFRDWAAPHYGNDAQQNWTILESLFEKLFAQIEPPSVLTLRDYHAENILIVGSEKGIKRIGLLDFQDAVLGHPAYDIASLIYDARRKVPKETAEATIQYFIKEMQRLGKPMHEKDFRFAVELFGAQRNIKIIGIFNRLADRDHKHHYRALIPHVWQLLETNLRHPDLHQIKDWFSMYVPAHNRTGTMQ